MQSVCELKSGISRDGQVVATASMKAVAGRVARVTIGDWCNIDGALRIQATMEAGAMTFRGEATADVDLLLLQNVPGAWVIFGEPRVRVLHATQANVQVSGAGGYGVAVDATPVDVSKRDG